MRRVLVIGSNGPPDLTPLKYAAHDAYRVGQALSAPRCGFELVPVSPKADAFTIKKSIIDAVESCQHQDALLIYFSGHGLLDKGNLFLLLDHTKTDRLLGTALPVTEMMQALSYCKAANKLFILDCCHAGAAITDYGFKDASELPLEEAVRAENFLVLMASKRLERAREVDALQAGFLAFNICSALTDKFHEAAAEGTNRLSVQQLKKWLELRAREFNQEHPEQQVPVPYLFGQQRGEFFLTVGDNDWIIHQVPWLDGSSLVVLPIYPMYRRAYCLAEFPVTNGQYKEIMDSEPVGEHFVRPYMLMSGKWQGPFHPWQDPHFSSLNQPVVCVSFEEAREYVRRVNEQTHSEAWSLDIEAGFTKGYPLTILPTTSIWDYAAFGTDGPPRNPKVWMARTKVVHHRASAPSAMDSRGTRTNSLGLADMVGNVWEWCQDSESLSRLIDSCGRPEVRGGSFLDDASKTPISLTIRALANRQDTRHSDLGFRIAGLVPVESLPEAVQIRLHLSRRLDPPPSLETPATA